MKTLSALSREALLQNTLVLVHEEGRIELALVAHLREIDRRQLHLEMGFSSLFEFAVKHLKLSEASAYRKIEAMKLMREIPEAKTAIEEGRLSLTNVATVQTFFRVEKKQGRARNLEEKRHILQQMEGLSKRECERRIAEIAPEVRPQERMRPVTAELTEARVVLDVETLALIEELKHARPGTSLGELIKHAVSVAVQEVRKSRTPRRSSGLLSPVEVNQAETRRQVFARAESRCQFVSPDGKRCTSTHALEIDHVMPRARGGTDAPENLRVLCRQHNGYEAVRILGVRAMQPYLPAVGE